METRAMLGVMFGAISCIAASGQEAPARPTPAQALYQLALTEWQSCRDQGLQLPSDKTGPALAIRLVQANRVVLATTPEQDDESREAWQAIAPPTAVARDLLTQAAAAPVGHLTFGGEWEAGVAVRQLEDLAVTVGNVARSDLQQHPAAAAQTALVLLRHARHLGTLTQKPFWLASCDATERAAALLADAVAAMPARDEHAALLARCIDELDRHLAGTIRPEDLQHRVREQIAPLLEKHRPRLRDMHQTTPGGYDEVDMRRRIEAELQRTFGFCDQQVTKAGEPWTQALCRHSVTLAEPEHKDDDVTSKAARGMAHLALCSMQSLIERQRDCLVVVRSCRDALATER